MGTTWPVYGLCPYMFGVLDLEISRVVSRVDLARTVLSLGTSCYHLHRRPCHHLHPLSAVHAQMGSHARCSLPVCRAAKHFIVQCHNVQTPIKEPRIMNARR